jgi:hypothetical protein
MLVHATIHQFFDAVPARLIFQAALLTAPKFSSTPRHLSNPERKK